MEENKNNKKKILILGILLVIVTIGVLGITYAAYNFQREGDSNELVTGDIYMHYKGKNAGISIDNAVPSKTYDKEKYFEFTIEGKNTYTEKDIWYEIDLVEGDQPDGRTTRIDDKYLRFALTEKIGTGKEKIVANLIGYDDITNKKIWVNKIDRNTNNEITITYKLYMWISDEVHIGYDDENEIQSDYTPDEWNNDVYASVKVNVKGDFIEKKRDTVEYGALPEDLPTNLLERIKKIAYYRDGEIIAVNKDGDRCESLESCADNIREYRYSGSYVNNYITLTDNNGTGEIWRIIGVFEDDEVGEYIKVVRDSILPESYLPATFKANNGNTYTIQSTNSNHEDYAYWNNLTGTSSDKNNWSTAGLQYWLNAEEADTEGNNNYLSYLSSDVRNQLVSVKHYLGTWKYDTDTVIQAYAHERDIESCVSNKSTSNNQAGCYVWAGNDATWTGKVSLMYPSDYGYSADEAQWRSGVLYNFSSSGASTTWMYSTMSDSKSKYSWMFSPSSAYSNSVGTWSASMYNDNYYGSVRNFNVYNDSLGVRPVLNLSSSVTWLDGDGTKNNPYVIIPD